MSHQSSVSSPVSQPRPVVPHEAAPLTVPQQNGGPPVSLPALPAARPRLTAALVQAILDCAPVPHDARNQHHG